MKVKITKLNNSTKKYKAEFFDNNSKKIKTTRFGASGYLDHTIGATKEQRERYRKRHRNDKINDKFSAGALSYHILWDTKSFRENVRKYKKRFNLS